MGKAHLCSEQIATILCDFEAIINARPFTYVSNSDDELHLLIPAVFLTDIQEKGVPGLDTIDAISLNRRLSYRKNLRDYLKQSFRTEYLGQITQRVKNSKRTLDVEKTQIVQMGSDHRRLDWPLAQVVEVIPGTDSVKRLLRLRTERGEIIWPVQRIYPLT